MSDHTEEESNGPPQDLDIADAWERSLEARSTKERVYEVATTITEPTRIAAIAERADCSKGGARTNLEWLAELGVVELVSEDPAMYRRNEAYFEFLRVDRLVREHDEGELEELNDGYDARERELADRFAVDSPADEDLHSTAKFEELDDAYDRLSDWITVRRRLRYLRRARLRQQDEVSESEGWSIT